MFEQILFGNTIQNYLWFSFYVALGVIVSFVVIFIIKTIFLKITQLTRNKIDDIIVKILSKPMPIRMLIILIFFNIGFKYLVVSNWLNVFVKQATFIVLVLAITLFLIKFFIGLIEEYLEENQKFLKTKNKDQLIPFLKSMIKIILFTLAFLAILSNFGYNVTALLAGLGIGGIAIAFAAKDILENFISGITIFIEKPFKIGDYLKTSEGTGTIEQIGIRSTKIRTPDNTVIILPNRLLSTNSVENISSRRARRENYILALVYETPLKKIETAKKIIQKILDKNEKIEKNTTIISFETFGDYSLNIRVIYWIKAPTYAEYLAIKNDINLEIKEKFEKEGIEFAQPVKVVKMKK